MQIDFQTIENASERIKAYVHRTPVITSANLDSLIDASIFFKCENLQKAGAFKTRGAVNAVFSLSEKELEKGVCTHSSGNHAAALARAASLRNTKAFVVMPNNSSKVKIAAVKNYGGEISFCSPNLESRENTLNEIREKTGAVEIHPYNDLQIIAGQATAAKELFEQTGSLDIIIAPVGGGGLLSGTALSAQFYSSETKVIAAEPKGADDAFRSFYSNSYVPSVNPQTIADGLLTSLGSLTFPIIQKHVHRIITVSEESILEAMKLIWERTKLIIEPSSAVPFAAILENRKDFYQKKVGIILSGGNVDLNQIPWNQ